MTLLVIHEHQVVGAHPDAAPLEIGPGGTLVVEPGQADATVYEAGGWSGAGVDIVCAFLVGDPSCRRCHPEGPGDGP